ncbi:MAG: hypothetical protein DWQ01_02805 [Planctomycetota bacterium]|nr:MAG: hypothetical protein DWQ01_02805 [Planctomycetota bacterium]
MCLPPVYPVPRPFDVDLVMLGFASQLLAGLLLGLSVGKGRPRRLLLELLGGTPPNLDYLRDAIQAKARGQAGAVAFVLGSILLLAGFTRSSTGGDWRVQAGGAVMLGVLTVAYLIFTDHYVARTLRRYLRDHLRQHPFPFHEHVQLTREIGELFGVPGGSDDTLDGYIAKVRQAVGISDRSSKVLRRPNL